MNVLPSKRPEKYFVPGQPVRVFGEHSGTRRWTKMTVKKVKPPDTIVCEFLIDNDRHTCEVDRAGFAIFTERDVVALMGLSDKDLATELQACTTRCQSTAGSSCPPISIQDIRTLNGENRTDGP